MKTIYEIAVENIPDPFDPDEIMPARAGHLANLERRGFVYGVRYARKELTRWHHPNVELPETDVEVLVMVHADGHTYDVMRYDKHGWWQKAPGGGWCAPNNAPIGWRHIHEI